MIRTALLVLVFFSPGSLMAQERKPAQEKPAPDKPEKTDRVPFGQTLNEYGVLNASGCMCEDLEDGEILPPPEITVPEPFQYLRPDLQITASQLTGDQRYPVLTEFKILSILASNPGRVYTRDLLLDKIQGGEVFVDDRNIDVHIRAIRHKLGSLSEAVVTVRGVGYKFRE